MMFKNFRRLFAGVFICGLITGAPAVLANTDWTDQVSPINYANWEDIAYGDFNHDGITDIVAANPDGAEEWSDASGLPVWIGTVVGGGNHMDWKLSIDSEPSGWTPNIPVADPMNSGVGYVSRVLCGNTGNMMATWDITLDQHARIDYCETISGTGSYDGTLAFNPDYQFWYQGPSMLYWDFTYDANQDNFRAASSRYGNMDPDNRMSLGVEYISDRGEFIGTITGGTPTSGTKIRVYIEPQQFVSSAYHHGHPSGTYPDFLTNDTINITFYLGEYMVDWRKYFAFRLYGGQPGEPYLEVGDTWHFTSPGGPYTKSAFKDVEVADMNLDGQDDLVACGPEGIHMYLQDGPKMSPFGFYAGAHNPEDCPDWAPGGIIQNGITLNTDRASIIQTEIWTLTFDESCNCWHVNGELSGAKPDYYPTELYAQSCHQFEFAPEAMAGTYCNGDTFIFSTFRNSWTGNLGPPASGAYESLALGDIDHNGKLDVAACRATGGIDVYSYSLTNNDSRGWTLASSPSFSGICTEIKLQDLNRDGWLDIIAVSPDSGLHVWFGLTGGNWSADYPPESDVGFESFALGDFNKDGYIDVAATAIEAEKSIHVFYLRSNGEWFQRAKASLPQADRENTGDGSVSAVKTSNSQTVTDVWTLTCMNEEGTLFWVETSNGYRHHDATVNELYVSDNGEVEFTIFPGPIAFALGDKFYFTTGKGPLSHLYYSDIDSGDLDNDGNMDLFAANSEQEGIRVWRGNGVYGWTLDTPPQDSNSWQTILGSQDINFDGNPDVIAGSNALGGIHIWIGDDNDKFSWSSWREAVPIQSGRYAKVDHGDFNLDGKVDIVAACLEDGKDGIWVWQGDNLGGFVNQNGPQSDSGYYAVAVADFNLDGKMDIAGGHQSQGLSVWMNQGDWQWSADTTSISGNIWDLKAGDIDNDGDPDLAVAQNYTASISGIVVYINNNGSFSPSNRILMPNSQFNFWGVEMADFNRDGKMDLRGTKSVGNQAILTYLQNNLGQFPTAFSYANPSGYDHFYGITTADFNLDSIPDHVVGEDGRGLLAGYGFGGDHYNCQYWESAFGWNQIRDLATGDLTNDGTPDLVVASKGDGIFAYRSNLSYPGISTFSQLTNPTQSGDYIGVTIVDVTSDGLPDVIGASEGAGASGVALWISQRDFGLLSLGNTFPQDGGTFNVGADNVIWVAFNKDVDVATVTYENIQLKKGNLTVPYSLFVRGDNKTVEISPINIERHVEYTVFIRGGVEGLRDTYGNQFDGNGDGSPQDSPTDDRFFTFETIDTVPPSVPGSLVAEPIDHGIRLNWAANSDPKLDSDLHGYWVSWRLQEDPPWNESYYTKAELGDPPGITIRGLDNEVPVFLSVVSQDTTGNYSSYAEWIEATPRSNKPQIWWAGWYNTDIFAGEGGRLTLMAYVFDQQVANGTETIESVEIYVQGSGTGVMLQDNGQSNDFGAGDGVYALSAPIAAGSLQPMSVPIELMATDSSGNQSYLWPYVHILEYLPGQSGAGADNSSLGRFFASQQAQFMRDTLIPYEPEFKAASHSRPQIWLAGYYTHPAADFEFGIKHGLTALVTDPDGAGDVARVELYVMGLPTGLEFLDDGTQEDFGAGDTVWGYTIQFPGQWNDPGTGHLPKGAISLEIKAFDHAGNVSDTWPYFVVN